MRYDGVNGVRGCSIPATASLSEVGRATQIPPRQLAAGIEALQPPAANAPAWFQAEAEGIIDPQPVLRPILGAMARTRPRSRSAEPIRWNMLGA
jgi:hypothetical protein